MLILPLTLALGSAPVAAGPQLPAQRATALRAVVDAKGLTFVEDHAPAARADGTSKLSAAGALWSYPDNGLAWIATAVSIGDRGGQVFAEYDLNNESAELFSAYDTNPPAPVWTDTTPLGTEFRSVDSADAEPIHIAIDQVVLNGNIQTRQAVLRKYTSSSGTPDWTHTFTPIINAAAKAAISRDGQTIVAAVMNNNTFDVEVSVFGPSSGTPLSTTPIAVGTNNYLRGFDLSADGSMLYFSAGTTLYLFDVATQQKVFSSPLPSSFDSHAISGDGSVFAYGSFNAMFVWERTGPTTWANTFTRTTSGQNYCAVIDISDDNSTIASGWTFYTTYATVRVEALDVATKLTTMSHLQTSPNTKQNILSDISISADGQRFAAGMWGDSSNTIPEVRIFDSQGSIGPVAELNLPGSVFDVDLSADGKRVVAGSKAVHANDFGNGGRLDLLDAGGSDFVLRGAPHLAANVQFDLYFPAGKNAILLQSLGEASPPQTFPTVGTLWIDRTTLSSSFVGVVPASGVITANLGIGSNPSLVGTALYFQGFKGPDRELSDDWVKMTILP